MILTNRKSILTVLAICFLFSASAICQEKVKLISIDPIPHDMTVKSKAPSSSSQGRSASYQQGVIDRIGEDDIVINDALRQVPRDIALFSSSGSSISKKSLQKGQAIAFRLGDNNQVTEIRLLNNSNLKR